MAEIKSDEGRRLRMPSLASTLEVVAPVSFLAPIVVMWVHLHEAFVAYGKVEPPKRQSLIAEWSSGNLTGATALGTVAVHLLVSLAFVALAVVAETVVSRSRADSEHRVVVASSVDLAAVREAMASLGDGLTAFAAEKGPQVEERLEEMSNYLLTASHSLQMLAAEARRDVTRDNGTRL